MKQNVPKNAGKPDRVLDLSCFKMHIELYFDKDHPGQFSGGSLTSQGLHEEDNPRFDRIERAEFDESEAAINSIEALVLAHAVAGIDVTTPAYMEGVETAIEAVYNNL